MPGAKRDHVATSEELESVSRKCQRVGSDGMTSVAMVALASTSTVSCGDGASLATLPTEIVQRIFYESCEASLIHTCRKLYQILPDYVLYTKSLTLLAYGPEAWSWHQFTVPNITLPLADVQPFVQLNQEELQIELSSNSWLTPAILQEACITMFEHVANASVLSPEMPLSSDERQNIEQRLLEIRKAFTLQHSRRMSVGPRSCPGNPYDGCGIVSDGVKLTIHNTQYVVSYHIFQPYAIPNCVLEDPTNPISLDLLESIACSTKYDKLWTPPHLMQQAILHVLRIPNVPWAQGHGQRTALRRLLRLIPHCEPSAPLTLEMLKVAVEMNKADMLRTLLCSLDIPEFIDAFPDDCYEALDEIQWNCSVGVDDLIRLELSLHSNQNDSEECYTVLAIAIKACCCGTYPNGLPADVAHSLGFENMEALKAARVSIRNMWFDEEPDYEEFQFDEYEGHQGELF